MDQLQVTLAGAVSLQRGDHELGDAAFPGRQLRLVIAMLVLERANPVTTAALAGELWPGQVPAQWRAAVRGLVSKTRRALVDVGLDPSVIEGDTGIYRVALDPVDVDLERAAGWVRQADGALDDDRPDDARGLANRARAVLSRPVLPGVTSDWLDGVRDRVGRDHLDSLLVLGTSRSHLDLHVQARAVLLEAAGLAPLREDAWRALMTAELAAGNAAGALDAYERCRAHLADELGVDPSGPTQELHQRILSAIPDPGTPNRDGGQAAGSAAPAHPAAGATPYVGLRAFRRADEDLFFGRDAEVQEVVARLARHGTVCVVGPSGVGKSSLVRAGLLPALARGAIPDSDTWTTILLVPGSDPLVSLATELARHPGVPDGTELHERLRTDPDALNGIADQVLASSEPTARLLLVIDQLEEAFTLAAAPDAAVLVEHLTTATRRLDARIVIVVTLRADFYDRAVGVPGMADLLSRTQYVVPPVAGEQVEAVITGPATATATTLEDGLLARILTDVAGEPGALPLLQHLLLELWQRRTQHVMTRWAYEQLGGVAGALANRAEAAYQACSTADRAVARSLLLRCVQPGEGTNDSRRPVAASEWQGLVDHDRADAVVDHFVQARLLTAKQDPTTGQRAVELAHEALIQGWPRLRAWVDEARGWLLDHRRLTIAAADWERHDRHDDWLLAGLPLDEAERLADSAATGEVDMTIAPAIEQFLAASAARRDDARAAEQVRIDVGEVRALLAESTAALEHDPPRGLHLAIEAARRGDKVPGRIDDAIDTVLRHAISAQRQIERFADVGQLLSIHPDGEAFATADVEMDPTTDCLVHVRFVDGRVVALPPHHNALLSAVFSRDGALLATGDHTGALRVWRVDDGMQVACVEGPAGAALMAWDFDPASRLLLGGDVAQRGELTQRIDARRRGATTIWALDSGEPVTVITAPHDDGSTPRRTDPLDDGGPSDARFSPDGSLVAIADWGDESWGHIVDVATGNVLVEVEGGRRTVATVAWSPDGAWLAFGGAHVTIIDVAGRRVHCTWVPADGMVGVGGLSWSADSGRLFVGTRTVQRWHPLLGHHELTFPGSGTGGGTNAVFATRDGRRLFSGSRSEGTVHVWDVSPDADCEVAWVPGGEYPSIAHSPDGSQLAVTAAAGCRIIDTGTWTVGPLLADEAADPLGVAWSRDGSRIAIAGPDRLVMVNPRSGSVVLDLAVPADAVGDAVAFTPDGHHLAVSERLSKGPGTGVWAGGYRIHIVDRDGLEVCQFARPGEGSTSNMTFTADGNFLVIARGGGLVPMFILDSGLDVWDWRRATLVRTIDTEAYDVAASPTGHRVVVGGTDGPAKVVDVATGEVERSLEGRGNGVVAVVAWSGDGQFIATGRSDARVLLLHAGSGAVAQVLELDTGEPVNDLAFSPDSRRLNVAQDSNGVRVWTLDRDELRRIAVERQRGGPA